MATKQTGWTGWIAFASAVMIIGGFFGIIGGLMAIFNNDLLVFNLDGVWAFDLTTWGWVDFIVGILTIWAATSLLHGGAFGRIWVVVASVLGAIANIALLPIYPFWATLALAVYIFVLYAVTVHGDELKD